LLVEQRGSTRAGRTRLRCAGCTAGVAVVVAVLAPSSRARIVKRMRDTTVKVFSTAMMQSAPAVTP